MINFENGDVIVRDSNSNTIIANYGNIMVLSTAQDWANKLATEPMTGLENFKDLLAFSQFELKRKALERVLSTKGRAAMFLLPMADGSWYLENFDLLGIPETIGNRILSVAGVSGKTHLYYGREFPIITRYFIENNKVKLERFINYSTLAEASGIKKINITRTIVLKGAKLIPAEIFHNNDLGKSDVSIVGLEGIVELMNYFSNQTKIEWEFTKTILQNNENFTDKQAEEIQRSIEEGRDRVLEGEGFDAKLQSGLGVIISGSQTITILETTINYLEDKYTQRIGVIRDTIGASGSNKHTAEVIFSQQHAVEYLRNKLSIRNVEYNSLFAKISQTTGIAFTKTEVGLSVVEQYKLAIMEAALKAEVASAQSTTPESGE